MLVHHLLHVVSNLELQLCMRNSQREDRTEEGHQRQGRENIWWTEILHTNLCFFIPLISC